MTSHLRTYWVMTFDLQAVTTMPFNESAHVLGPRFTKTQWCTQQQNINMFVDLASSFHLSFLYSKIYFAFGRRHCFLWSSILNIVPGVLLFLFVCISCWQFTAYTKSSKLSESVAMLYPNTHIQHAGLIVCSTQSITQWSNDKKIATTHPPAHTWQQHLFLPNITWNRFYFHFLRGVQYGNAW